MRKLANHDMSIRHLIDSLLAKPLTVRKTILRSLRASGRITQAQYERIAAVVEVE